MKGPQLVFNKYRGFHFGSYVGRVGGGGGLYLKDGKGRGERERGGRWMRLVFLYGVVSEKS